MIIQVNKKDKIKKQKKNIITILTLTNFLCL